MAKDVKFLISASPTVAIAAMKEMQKKGEDVSGVLSTAFRQLGVTSETSFLKQKQAATTAYELIKQSGVASASDIAKAHQAMQAKIAALNGDTAKSSHQVSAGLTGIDSAANLARNALTGIATVSFAGLVQQVASAGLEMERLSARMKAASGNSAVLAGVEMQYVREEASRLGLDLQTTAGAFGKFAAATRGTSLEGEGARKVFSAVSEAATAMKLTADESQGIFLALSQMMSKGKVSAEELTGQLGERLPGALKLAADGMGMTTAELMKQMQEGKILSSDLLPKLAEQLHKTYGQAATDAAKQGTAELARFRTEIFETSAAIGNKILPSISEYARSITDALKSIRTQESGGLSNFAFLFGKPFPKEAAKAPDPAIATKELDAKNRQAMNAAIAKDKEMQEQRKQQAEKFEKERLTGLEKQGRAASEIYQLELHEQAKAFQEMSEIYQLTLRDQLRAKELAVQEMSDIYQMELRDQQRAEQAATTYADVLRKLEDDLLATVAAHKDLSAIEAKIKSGRDALTDSTKALDLAQRAGNTAQITMLQKVIALQEASISRMERQRAHAEALSVLNGSIVGFDNNRPIYANAGGAFSGGNAVDTYQPLGNESGFQSVTNDPWFNRQYTNGFAVGTRYVPKTGMYQLHQGEKVSNRTESRESQTGNQVTVSIGDIIVQGATNGAETAREIARTIYPELQKLGLRFRAA